MQRNSVWCVTVIASVLCGGTALGGESAFALVRDGRAVATVVLAAGSTMSADFALEELQYHVQLMTGTRLGVVDDTASFPGPRILLGESVGTRKLGLRSADFRPQEHLVRFDRDTLILMGRDDADNEAGAVDNRPSRTPGKFGGGMRFDGAARIISVPESGFDDAAGSLEAWVWLPAAKPEKHGTVFRLDGGPPWGYHIVQRDAGTNRISYTVYNTAQSQRVLSGDLGEGWHRLLATHSVRDNRIELFVNGRSVGSASYPLTGCRKSVLHLGGLATSSVAGGVANAFSGILDEVRVSRVVRSPAADGGIPHANDTDTPLLLHFDERAGGLVDAGGRSLGSSFPRIFGNHGTVNAVYDFLEEYANVRWYAPGEIGVVCPRTTSLVLRPGPDIRRAPAMAHRALAGGQLLMPTAQDPVGGRDTTLWRFRMRQGGPFTTVGHSFYGYYDAWPGCRISLPGSTTPHAWPS